MAFVIVMIMGVMFLTFLFWKGFDDGRFLLFYSENNLKNRDFILRFCGIITMYGTAVTSILGIVGENFSSIIISLIIIAVFILESVFAFKSKNN
ncbi:MAG: hypothetical protein K2F73_03000 [Ruminococcus sp.]|nr:hypothetical protein [Ruminococcus sp.]